jgi:hypothetical protein
MQPIAQESRCDCEDESRISSPASKEPVYSAMNDLLWQNDA